MTAVLLTPPGTDREEWLAARTAGIGASEIAAVLGISPWDSPFSLYWKKANGWSAEDNGSMEAGRRLEAAIADWAADRLDPNENLRFEAAGLYASAERPWQLATPDRLVHLPCAGCDGEGATELAEQLVYCSACEGTGAGQLVAVVETKHPYSWDGFGEDGTDDIPVYYRAQLLWQMDVMEVDEGYLAAYCNHELRIFHVQLDERAEGDLRVMRGEGGDFWRRVTEGDIPDVDGHAATLATLRRLHPSVEDTDVDVPVDLAEEYRLARASRAEAEKRVDAAEARLRLAIGGGRRAMCNGKLVASRSVYEQGGDSAELTALEDDWPVVDRLNPGRAATYALEQS